MFGSTVSPNFSWKARFASALMPMACCSGQRRGRGEGVVRAPFLLLQRRGRGEGVVHAPFLLMQLLLDAKNKETVK